MQRSSRMLGPRASSNFGSVRTWSVVATGRPYSNRFVSVITIRDRKVTHWRDFLDPLAVFDALGTAGPMRSSD